MNDEASAPGIVERRVRFGTAELIPDGQHAGRWAIVVDGVLQSYVDLTDPTYLEMPFTAWIAQAVDEFWPQQQAISAVHVGGGGFTVARYLAATRPGSVQTVFELDDLLTGLVRDHLELDAVPGLHVRAAGGRAGVERLPDAATDLVVQDAYQAGAPVPGLATVEFVRETARVLRPGGLYVTNMWGGSELEFVLRSVASIAAVFGHVLVFAEAGVFMRVRPGNFVVAASERALPHAELTEWASGTENRVFCLNTAQLAAACGRGAPLSDAEEAGVDAPAVLRWGRGSRFKS